MHNIILKPRRDYSLVRRHPWVFSGAIAQEPTNLAPGTTVCVLDDKGQALGWGAYSGVSQIRVRMWSFEPEVKIDAGFIAARVARAIGARAIFLVDGVTTAYRLINGEGDGLPGVIVDHYAGWLVCQFTTAGAELWRHTIVEALAQWFPCQGIYERSDVTTRQNEGLEPRCGLLHGTMPPDEILIEEYGCRYQVSVQHGHKTGFYLDQRENRHKIKPLANGGDVLNAFAYSGGFGVAALTAGAATITHIEQSAEVLAQAKVNTQLNHCELKDSTFVQGDVFTVLREYRDAQRQFDMIILDPPKFVQGKMSLRRGARGYKDINLLAMKLLRPNGVLATFSCSGAINTEFFNKIIQDAAVDARRDVQIIERLFQAPDHPEALGMPESLYLKGLLCRIW